MLRQNFMKQTANSGQPQYKEKARKYMKEYMDKGYLCGRAAMEALAGAYEIPLCQEIIHQSLAFTEGGGVGDRCAVFQAVKLAEGFRKAEGSYVCRELYNGNRESCIQYAGEAADLLSEIFEEKKNERTIKTV